jgi:N-acetylglucosamine-6-sulfatase
MIVVHDGLITFAPSKNSYFIYSSDHGFQLGELNLPQDKRNVYEFDTKIHMIARGPGIAPGSHFTYVVTGDC